MTPHLFRGGNDELVSNLKATSGNAIVNGFPITQLHSMVHTVYHFEKSEAINGLIEQAQPIGREAGAKGGGKTTGTGSQSPVKIMTKVMCELTFTIDTARNTWQQRRFTKPMGARA